MRLIEAIPVCVLLLALVGCERGPAAPSQAQRLAVATVRSAQSIGASRDPVASQHLERAREHVHTGLALIEENEHADAAVSFHRAIAEAERAVVLTREAHVVEEIRSASAGDGATFRQSAAEFSGLESDLVTTTGEVAP